MNYSTPMTLGAQNSFREASTNRLHIGGTSLQRNRSTNEPASFLSDCWHAGYGVLPGTYPVGTYCGSA